MRCLRASPCRSSESPSCKLIGALNRDGLANALAVEPLADLWPRALALYEESGSYRRSEANFRDVITPFAGRLSAAQHNQLLNAIIENGQNWDAGETDTLLLALLRNAPAAERPTPEARDQFYQFIRRMRRLDKYGEVIALLREDGWAEPAPQQDEDE